MQNYVLPDDVVKDQISAKSILEINKLHVSYLFHIYFFLKTEELGTQGIKKPLTA